MPTSSDTNELIQAIPLLTAAILSLAIIRFALGQEIWSIAGLIELVILTYLVYTVIVGVTSGVAAI